MGGLVLAAIVVSVAAFFPTGAAQTGPDQVVGAIVPSLKFPLTSGGTVKLDDLRGKNVLINVWATWCGPCRREMPALQRLAREQVGRLYVIAVDQGEDRSLAAAYAKRFGVTFGIGIDREQRLGTALHLVGLPSSFFVDSRGVIREAVDGEMTYEAMSLKAKKLLAGG